MKLLLLLACLKTISGDEYNTLEDLAVRNLALYDRIRGNGSDYGSKSLGRDERSGCLCREYVRRYVTCYDIENCRRFPKNIRVNLDTFKIGTTAIAEIVAGDLENVRHLQVLLIEANNKLTRLEAGVFRNMSRLVNMSISYNPKLLSLDEGLFDGLVNLEELMLAKNGFDEIKDFSAALSALAMPKLLKLNLKEMHCPDVGKEDLVNLTGSRLVELNFINSQIEYIHPDAFAPLTNLQVLTLGANNVNVSTLINLVHALVETRIPLKTLSLFGLGFRKDVPKDLLEAVAKSNVTKLSLCKNQFDAIGDDSFPLMPNLKYLDLSNVLVGNVTPGAFHTLPNLKTLLLNKNKFSTVPDGALLTTLENLDLSENSAPDTTPSYFTLEKNKFIIMTGLKRLNLSHNNVRKVPRQCFNGLIHLEVLSLRESNIFLIDDGAFGNLENLMCLNLEKNPFPTRNFNKDIFIGLKKLEVLLIGYCGITSIPGNSSLFEHLPNLKHLDLQGNKLKVLNPAILAPLPKLSRINFAENTLIAWQERLFLRNKLLTILVAYDNKFAYLSKAMLDDFAKLKVIDISKNPFNCECHSFRALHDFDSINRILRIIEDCPSYCVYPDEYVNYTIIDYFNTIKTGQICETNLFEEHVAYIVPLIMLAFVAACSVIVYIYRWHIRYWMFLTKMALHRNKQFLKKAKSPCHVKYEYDAFVSYSNEDRNFVVRLVAMLENQEPHLRLCVYERDFQIGTVISETVLESVAKSRKTLLVISDSYIKSQWCRWEVQVAEHRRLFFENEQGECVNDSIVMIKLGNIAYANLSPMLRYLMKTRIYLLWDPAEGKQKVFWEKLRNALAPPPKVETVDQDRKGTGGA